MCNILLSNRPFYTIYERLEYLLIRYPSKFKKVLNLPDWKQEDINELSGRLKIIVVKGMAKKWFILQKIEYIKIFLNNEHKLNNTFYDCEE